VYHQRDRSCFLREATTDRELDDRLYAMGDFGKIMNVAKRNLHRNGILNKYSFLFAGIGAKRIGLLFSSAQIDYNLDPRRIGDIPDIRVGDEVFSDGCGLISKYLAVQLSKAKKIIFRGVRYTPTIFQIR
jgi:hypothetical protein